MRDSNLNVLVIGGGGREHALTAALVSSARVASVVCAPGNAGMAQIAECVPVGVKEHGRLVDLARKREIDMAVCGPETPLIAGLADEFLEAGIPFFGPREYNAQIEGSKIFAKQVMQEAKVPTGDWEAFDAFEPALKAAGRRLSRDGGVVIKADGEAAGKGVFVCEDISQAQAALQTILVDRAFGSSGDRVLVEERLTGQEVSVMVIATGEKIVAMPPVQDHKRVFDGDRGPNTGGMGCYSPVPVLPPDLHRQALDVAVLPVLRWFGIKGMPYFGCLYAGLMITDKGLKVLEYNCRFGDPETQVALPMLRSDFGEIMVAAVSNRLDRIKPAWYDGCGVCVVLASGGYPGEYATGYPIHGVDELNHTDKVSVFHAGTSLDGDQLVTSGGRVLCVTALDDSFVEARRRAYEALSHISFQDMHFRKDIGARLS